MYRFLWWSTCIKLSKDLHEDIIWLSESIKINTILGQIRASSNWMRFSRKYTTSYTLKDVLLGGPFQIVSFLNQHLKSQHLATGRGKCRRISCMQPLVYSKKTYHKLLKSFWFQLNCLWKVNALAFTDDIYRHKKIDDRLRLSAIHTPGIL